jgi:CubicO group peptidase (beta-lactamase class C family)
MVLPSTAFAALTVGFATFTLAEKIKPCALLGPDVPPPRAPSNTSAFKDAIASLKKAIPDAIRSGKTKYGTMDASSTSFSVDVFSVHEGPLFTYHYDAPGLAHSTAGVKEINSNSIYRLGSISKLLTVYTFLAAVGDSSFHEPITKFIHELASLSAQHPVNEDSFTTTDWSVVTVGALASQLGGIPRETAGDARSDPMQNEYLPPGVPLPIVRPTPRNLSDNNCPNPLVVPCTRAAFLQSINLEHPSLAPFWGPSYSNVGFGLLGLALENMTNESFPNVMTSELIRPLDLTGTYYSNAPVSRGVIPHNVSAAQYSAGGEVEDPAGSYYSSINDMRKIGISMLNSTMLSPAQTRRWMKPQTFTANDNFAVGAPWEIYKGPLADKTTWMYTKGGDIGLYSTNFVLLPDYDMGFTILTAGDDSLDVNNVITDIVAAIGVPAMENAAKEEANRVYAGVYRDSKTGDTLTLDLDENPGLLVSEWQLNGTNAAKAFLDGGFKVRLNPSGLQSEDGKKLGFRMVLNQPQKPKGAIVQNCVDWFAISGAVLGGVALDDFVITLSDDRSKALAVNARGWREIYSR